METRTIPQNMGHTREAATALIILDRFQGPDGKRQLMEAISAQTLVRGSELIARDLADASELVGCEPGEVIIEQNDATNELYMILTGSFSITVNGRPVAERHVHQTVGEMSVVDPASRRSATVIAREQSVVARIPEPTFAKIAAEYPDLWRRIAAELAERLRQRNQLVRMRNKSPRVFIGSSTESLAIAHAIQSGLGRRGLGVDVWTNGVFGPSEFPIESLEREAQEKDFAVLVLGPDDRVNSRSVKKDAPRDNVVLELGLFIGAFGHSRVFMVLPEKVDIKIPTDLLGVTPLFYRPAEPRYLSRRMQPVCEQLNKVFEQLGPR
jgi:predicted nucleotide-binding protein